MVKIDDFEDLPELWSEEKKESKLSKSWKKLKKGLVTLGVAAILSYPIYVGAGAAYYSTSEFTFRTPPAIEYVSNLNIPQKQDVMVVVTGGENPKTGESYKINKDCVNLPHADTFFNVVLFNGSFHEKLSEKQKRQVSGEDFYHELGHIIYSDMPKESTEKSRRPPYPYSIFKDEIEDKYDTVMKAVNGIDAVYSYLKMKSIEYGSGDKKIDGIKYVKLENHRELIKCTQNINKGENTLFIDMCPDPDEFFAVQTEKYLGGNENEFIPDLSYLVKESIDDKIQNKPDVVYGSLRYFPNIYKHMFIQGIRNAQDYITEKFVGTPKLQEMKDVPIPLE